MPNVTISTRAGIAADGAGCYEATAHEELANGNRRPVVKNTGEPLELTATTEQGAIERMRNALGRKFPGGWTEVT